MLFETKPVKLVVNILCFVCRLGASAGALCGNDGSMTAADVTDLKRQAVRVLKQASGRHVLSVWA